MLTAKISELIKQIFFTIKCFTTNIFYHHASGGVGGVLASLTIGERVLWQLFLNKTSMLKTKTMTIYFTWWSHKLKKRHFSPEKIFLPAPST